MDQFFSVFQEYSVTTTTTVLLITSQSTHQLLFFILVALKEPLAFLVFFWLLIMLGKILPTLSHTFTVSPTDTSCSFSLYEFAPVYSFMLAFEPQVLKQQTFEWKKFSPFSHQNYSNWWTDLFYFWLGATALFTFSLPSSTHISLFINTGIYSNIL